MTTERVSITNLQAIVDRINRYTGSPAAPWTRQSDGTMRANVGNFHLDQAYGGVELQRMVNEGGGVSDVLMSGHVSKRECRDLMFAFIRGLELAQGSK